MDAGGVLMRMTTVLALMAALMMMAIVTTTTMMTEAAPTCGFEQLAERGGRTRRDIVSGLTPTVDSRFAFPSDDSSADVAPSKCTVKDDVASIFGIGYSECYSPEVTAHYSNLESWPDTTLKVKFKTITNDTGTGFVTQDDFEHALGLLNSSYANAGISFTGDADFVASQTIFDSMVNTAGYTSSNLFGVLDPLSQVLGIDQDLETRDVHSYIVVLKLDMSEIVGVCVPETGMLSARAQVLKDASGVPDWWGNICFLDYRWFSVRGINALADARSNGLYTIHEMGHSLGLLHTFQAAAYKFANGACVAPDYVGSSCFAEDDSFENGDYIADTAVMVSSTVASPGGSIFDNATCMAGPRYPGHCNGNPFADLASTDTNYMSYVPEPCYDSFSDGQIGRMRCMIDRYVLPRGSQRMANTRAYPPVVSRAIFKKKDSAMVTVEWLPPVNLLHTAGATLPQPALLQFQIERTPAFSSGTVMVDAATYMYIDTDVSGDLSTYSYRVVAVYDGERGGETAFVAASTSAAAHTRALACVFVSLFAVLVSALTWM